MRNRQKLIYHNKILSQSSENIEANIKIIKKINSALFQQDDKNEVDINILHAKGEP